MQFDDHFQEDPPAEQHADLLVLNLDGFDGPIDLLLTLARDQKVDLTKISILALADQYLDFIERARALRLEIAADYLVMAAWLAYLKSRLLLPEQPAEENEEDPAEMAARLAFQLQRLESMKKAAESLLGKPRLGQDFFKRGQPETTRVETQTVLDVTLYELLRAYGRMVDKKVASTLRIMPTQLYSMDDAIERLRGLVGTVPDWHNLAEYLPGNLKEPLISRSALASYFAASLELVREGKLDIRQNGTFQPIFVRPRDESEADHSESDAPHADNDNLDS